MKNLLFLGAGILLISSCSSPYKTTYQATDVQVTPVVVESNFKTQYPNATNVIWGYYDPAETGIPIELQLAGYTPLAADVRMVHFNQENNSYQVMYDRNGIKLATAQTIADLNSLPASIRDQLLSLYPNSVISGLSRVTLNNQAEKMAYEVQMKKMYYTVKVLVDDNGHIIDQRTIVNEKADPAGMRTGNDDSMDSTIRK